MYGKGKQLTTPWFSGRSFRLIQEGGWLSVTEPCREAGPGWRVDSMIRSY